MWVKYDTNSTFSTVCHKIPSKTIFILTTEINFADSMVEDTWLADSSPVNGAHGAGAAAR